MTIEKLLEKEKEYTKKKEEFLKSIGYINRFTKFKCCANCENFDYDCPEEKSGAYCKVIEKIWKQVHPMYGKENSTSEFSICIYYIPQYYMEK